MSFEYTCSRHGRFMYYGWPAQQNNNIFDYFPPFFEQKQFDTVIEIGTSEGGFSHYIYDLSQEHNFKFWTYDIENKLKKTPPFDFRNKSAWDGDGYAEIVEGIANGGKTLLLVDGGNKIKEFNLYAPFLKEGDFIMTHDYAPDHEYHKVLMRDQIWEWCENVQEDLDIYENSLMPAPSWSQQFLNVAWSCWEKF